MADRPAKDDNGVIGTLSPIGLGYNTNMVGTAPTAWGDLTSEEFKGNTALYTITNSAGYMSC